MTSEKTNIFIVLSLIALLGLSLVQAYLLYTGILIEKEKFDDKIDETLLDIHHNVEDDRGLSEKLIRILSAYEKGQKRDSTLVLAVIEEMKRRIDSISYENGINLAFDFVFFDTENAKNVITSSSSLKKNINYQSKSIKAGWRIRESLGEGKYRIGLHYYNDFLYLLDQVKYVLLFSLFLYLLLVSGMYYIIRSWKKQKRISELKNEFINNMAHELKTPIFSMSLIQNIIKDKMNGSDEKLEKYFTLFGTETKKLKKKIDRVLDMAMMEQQMLKMNFEMTDPNRFLKEITDKYDLIVSSLGGSMQTDLDPDLPSIKIDRIQLENALANLLDNAIKYSEGPPDIIFRSGRNRTGIFIKVIDQGIGIPQYAQKMIFDRFYRVSSGNIHNVKGFGIGLSHVKLVAEEHGGSAEVESEPGKGSEFTINLSGC